MRDNTWSSLICIIMCCKSNRFGVPLGALWLWIIGFTAAHYVSLLKRPLGWWAVVMNRRFPVSPRIALVLPCAQIRLRDGRSATAVHQRVPKNIRNEYEFCELDLKGVGTYESEGTLKARAWWYLTLLLSQMIRAKLVLRISSSWPVT